MSRGPARTHPAVRGFDRGAATYERARPGYPAAAIAALARALDLRPRRTIVELASGTGKFTRALLPTGAAIVAVEPTRGMRAVFERAVPTVAVVDGTAEAIPVPDGFADAVVAAQAFHWFRPEPTVREIARVLRPGGGLGIVWNHRDESVPFSRRLSELIAPYRRSAPNSPGRGGSRAGAPAGAWRAELDRRDGPFRPLRVRRFRHVQRLTRGGVIDRALSVSVVAALPAPERRRVARAVRAILDSEPGTRGRAVIELPYETEVFWTRRR